MNRTQIHDLQDSKEIRGDQLNRVNTQTHTEERVLGQRGTSVLGLRLGAPHPYPIKPNGLSFGSSGWCCMLVIQEARRYGACERETVQYGAWGRTSPDLDTRLDSAHSVASPRPSSIGEYSTSLSLSARSLSPFTGLACFLVTGSLPRSLLYGRVFLMVRRSFTEQVWRRCDPQKQKQISTVDHSCDCGAGTPINPITVCLAADPNGVSKIYSNG